MKTTITDGWPIEYNGPRSVLGDGHISWASRPRIRQNHEGRWSWTCTPRFIAGEAFDDFKSLSDAGYHVTIHTRGRTLFISIVEREDSQ